MHERCALDGPSVRARGDAGNPRRHARGDRFTDRRTWTVVANTAIARELTGW